VLIAFVTYQAYATLGLHMRDRGLDTRTYGLMMSLNGLLIVCLELPLVAVARRYPPRPVLALGLLLTGLGFGLTGLASLRLTRTRTVMVRFRGAELRGHEGDLGAPPEVLRAIVTFVRGRTRAQRALAQQMILGHPVARPAVMRRGERTLPDDEPMAATLAEWHARYNAIHFAGQLRRVPVRVSRRPSELARLWLGAMTVPGVDAHATLARGIVRMRLTSEVLPAAALDGGDRVIYESAPPGRRAGATVEVHAVLSRRLRDRPAVPVAAAAVSLVVGLAIGLALYGRHRRAKAAVASAA
jgi:hypothetical protein